MQTITFTIAQESDGGFTAWWDDPMGGGISTQGATLEEVEAGILDAVKCHFEAENRPSRVLLHFASDLSLVVA